MHAEIAELLFQEFGLASSVLTGGSTVLRLQVKPMAPPAARTITRPAPAPQETPFSPIAVIY